MDALQYTTPEVSELYDKYADMLYRISYSFLLSKEDSEDALQNIFVSIMHKKPTFKDAEHEKAWFIRVTINQCHDIARHHKRHSYTPLEEMVELSAEATPEEKDLLSCVYQLPEKYKSVILLYYYEDLSIKEIASLLRITTSAVKMRMSRGKDLLKPIIEKEDVL